MKKRITSLMAIATVLLLGLLEAKDQPNIVFFIVDDHQRDYYSFLPEEAGDKPKIQGMMPHLDHMAKEGIVLSELHVPSPICVPSRYIALTGTYCSRATNKKFLKEATTWKYPRVAQNPNIHSGTVTLVQRLKKAGYKTAGLGKNHVIEVPKRKLITSDQKISDAQTMRAVRHNTRVERKAWKAAGFDYAERLYHDNVLANGPRELNPHNLDWIVEGASQFLGSTGDQPFFLYFATTTPHEPYGHWETGNRRATPNGMLEKAPEGLLSKESMRAHLLAQGYKPGTEAWAKAGDVLWTDAAMGAIVQKLKELNKLENTIFIYFNDHGIESGKTTLYQGGMRSLAVIKGPEKYIKGGRILDKLTSSVDFGTTFMSWAGIPEEANELDGVDLSPLLSGKTHKVRETVYGEIGTTRVIRKGKWKYMALREPDVIKYMSLDERQKRLDKAAIQMANQGDAPFPNGVNEPFSHSAKIPGGWSNTWPAMKEHPAYFDADQLYNLSTDPNEQVNLAKDSRYAGVLKELQAELSLHLSKLPGQFGNF